MNTTLNTIHTGDALEILKTMPDESVHCCVTSPPYWGLRDYGVDGQIGLEKDPGEYLSILVDVFREIRRVMRNDGTAWVNMGDSYAGYWGDKYAHKPFGRNRAPDESTPPNKPSLDFKSLRIKPKDLIGIPWRLAFALQDDGWYLRQDIIWHKPTAMPESVRDRCTKCHEYIFLLSKSERYFYDQDAIKETASADTHARYARGRSDHHKWADGGPGNQSIAKSMAHMLKPGVNPKAASRFVGGWQSGPGTHSAICHNQPHASPTKFPKPKQNPSFSNVVKDVVEFRNKRSVWSVSPEPFSGAHFATFPQKLIAPMILAGAPPRGVVLDPFMGAGTVAVVARKLGRSFVGIELNPSYVDMAQRRLEKEIGILFEEEREMTAQ